MKSRLFLFLSISSLLILFVSGQLNAAAIYRYTGNNFNAFNGNEYDASMKITGILEFESDLPPNLTNASLTPISFNFKDGINAINNKNIDSQIMSFSTGPNGEITDWEIDVQTSYPEPTSAGDSWYRIRTTYTNDFGQTAHCIIVDTLGHCATSAVPN